MITRVPAALRLTYTHRRCGVAQRTAMQADTSNEKDINNRPLFFYPFHPFHLWFMIVF
jgi:hypothetical protein